MASTMLKAYFHYGWQR